MAFHVARQSLLPFFLHKSHSAEASTRAGLHNSLVIEDPITDLREENINACRSIDPTQRLLFGVPGCLHPPFHHSIL